MTKAQERAAQRIAERAAKYAAEETAKHAQAAERAGKERARAAAELVLADSNGGRTPRKTEVSALAADIAFQETIAKSLLLFTPEEQVARDAALEKASKLLTPEELRLLQVIPARSGLRYRYFRVSGGDVYKDRIVDNFITACHIAEARYKTSKTGRPAHVRLWLKVATFGHNEES